MRHNGGTLRVGDLDGLDEDEIRDLFGTPMECDGCSLAVGCVADCDDDDAPVEIPSAVDDHLLALRSAYGTRLDGTLVLEPNLEMPVCVVAP